MKISEIAISNYRAFYNEKGEEFTKYRFDLKPGKNLLVYGENGSGKSSFYKGLRDLFQSSVDLDCKLIPNVFSRGLELNEQPFVEVTFTEKGKSDEVYRFSSDPHRRKTDSNLLKAVVRSRSFMTYRDLLRVHFVSDPEVNLFDFLFGKEGLLAGLLNPSFSRPETNLKMGDLFKVIKNKPDEINIKDFVNGVNRILADLNQSLNCLLKYFDQSLSVTFSVLTEEALKEGKPVVKAEVIYFGIDLSKENEPYHHFLNEARLSALAICIFLAAHLSVPSPPYEILFLDDIFTGLDTSNRIPLLDILTDQIIAGTTSDTFIYHQIILTTYDRQWYELARNHLGNTKWSFQEMYIDRHTKGFDYPALLPSKDNFERAKYYFTMKQYPACANFQRKICESLIKQFLPDNRKYDALPNGEIVPVTKLNTFITKLQLYLEENNLSFAPFRKLKNCLRVVMNPLSHDDFESPVYRRELELVFDIINELQKLKNIIILNAGKKIRMRKINPQTGLEREYVCELTTPIRRIEHGDEKRIVSFNILPLTQKEGDQKKEKISFGGKFEEIYGKLCHSLTIEKAQDPFNDFELMDGTPMIQLFT